MTTYEEIRNLQNTERNSPSLQSIDPSIFYKIKEYLAEKKKIIEENKGKEDNLFSKDLVEKNEKELKNVYKVLEDLCFRRYKKIVNLALNNVKAKIHDTENMLPEEEKFYNQLIEMLKNKFSEFITQFEKREEIKKEDKDMILLRIVDDIPEFLWRDEKTYGPYAKEDIVNLPEELGKILIEQDKAVEMIMEDDDNEDEKKAEKNI